MIMILNLFAKAIFFVFGVILKDRIDQQKDSCEECTRIVVFLREFKLTKPL